MKPRTKTVPASRDLGSIDKSSLRMPSALNACAMPCPRSSPNSVCCVRAESTGKSQELLVKFRRETRLRRHHWAFSNHPVVKD